MTEFNPIYLTEEEHTALDHTGVPGVQNGATDWAAVEEPIIHLTATDGSEGAGLAFNVPDVGGMHIDSDIGVVFSALNVLLLQAGNSVSFSAQSMDFNGVTTRPTVPVTDPTVQDVIDALLSFGLIVQSDG